MATYSYVALEDSGRRRTGSVDAADEATAVASVSANGFHVLDIRESSSAFSDAGPKNSKYSRITRADLAMFTRRLAVLATAGLPLDRALLVAGEQSENAALQAVVDGALKDVRAGMPVSDALGKYPNLFPRAVTMTLQAGEASGQFGAVASRLATMQMLEVRRRSKLITSLIYPALLAVTAVTVVILLVTFVLPRISAVLTELHTELPLNTKIVLWSSHAIARYGVFMVVALVLLFAVYRAWTLTAAGAMFRDRIALKLPVMGKVLFKAVISRYARLLGTLLYGGVPILESLRIAGGGAGNRVIQEANGFVEKQVREGHRVAEAMRETQVFPSTLVHMVSVGEETGDLPEMLAQVSDALDFEVDEGMQRATAIVEPAIILLMGIFIGFIVISILMPIYQAQSSIGNVR